MIEQILADYAHAYGLRSVIFRCFNVAGADPENLWQVRSSPTHLLTNVLRVVAEGTLAVPVFGVDYPTHDGSAVRDYVHVKDVCRAHEKALDYLAATPMQETPAVFNIASGQGHSVLEVMQAIQEVIEKPIQSEYKARRSGGVAQLYGDIEHTRKNLLWEPQHSDLRNIVRTAWAVMQYS